MKANSIITIALLAAFLFGGCRQQQEDRVRIGIVLSLTGSMSNYGQNSYAALSAMNELINTERKKKGYPLFELIYEDDRLEPKTGVAAVRKLISMDKVAAIIGAQASSVSLAIAPIAESGKTVMISPASATADLTKAGDYIFRTVLSGAVEATVSADLYRRYYDGKKLAVLHINNEYGQSLKKVFLASLQQPGILVVPYGDKDTDFRTYLTKIKDAGIQVVYIVGYNELVHIFRQAGELGLGVQWIGAAQIGNQSIVEKLGTTADGIVFPSWEMNLDEIRSGNQQFYSLFLKGSGNTPLDPFAANAVDALNLLDSIIGPKLLTGEEIKNSLYKISGFRGLTGALSFDANGDVQRRLAVRTIRNGKVVASEQPSN